MKKDNSKPAIYPFKYVKVFAVMFAGNCTAHFLFQQQAFNEKILEIIGASLLATFFWWLYDWTTAREVEQ